MALEIFLRYLQVFAVGGGICMLGQILINTTKMTSARILVIFLLLGVVLEAFGLFDALADFGMAGVKIPICGFGSSLVKGVITAVMEDDIMGAFAGGMKSVSVGITAAIFFSFIYALIFSPHSKKV